MAVFEQMLQLYTKPLINHQGFLMLTISVFNFERMTETVHYLRIKWKLCEFTIIQSVQKIWLEQGSSARQLESNVAPRFRPASDNNSTFRGDLNMLMYESVRYYITDTPPHYLKLLNYINMLMPENIF